MPARCLVAGVLFLLVSVEAHAWGWDGHRLICELAESKLTPEAKSLVDGLLADGKGLKGGQVSFAEACLWPDDVKYGTHQGTYEQHFINVPDDATTVVLARDCAALNCLAVGVQKAISYMTQPGDAERDVLRRAAALRFLGHYIGDLHQPLHVGNASDWGGNKVTVTWAGKETNLHGLWDYGMLESIGITYPDGLAFLATVKLPVDGALDVTAWLDESLVLARSNAYVNVDNSIITTGTILSRDYLERNKPVLIERLVLASDRLALLLNEIAAGRAPVAFSIGR